jgi:hypothetical protein
MSGYSYRKRERRAIPAVSGPVVRIITILFPGMLVRGPQVLRIVAT